MRVHEKINFLELWASYFFCFFYDFKISTNLNYFVWFLFVFEKDKKFSLPETVL